MNGMLFSIFWQSITVIEWRLKSTQKPKTIDGGARDWRAGINEASVMETRVQQWFSASVASPLSSATADLSLLNAISPKIMPISTFN